MEKIKLYTRDGGYVVTVTMPIFNPMAEVIVWGERVFVRRPDGKYYEGLAWPANVNKEFDEFEEESAEETRVKQALSDAQKTVEPLADRVLESENIDAELWNLTLTESKQRGGFDYGKQRPDGQFERHPTIPTQPSEFVRPLRHSYKHLKCGGITSMGDAIARTYAAKPGFYDGTFCATCHSYFNFKSDDGKFVWIDEQTKQPTDEPVGS